MLLSVSDLVVYADGRVGATVTTANLTDTFTDLIVFAGTDDGWKIDQVVLGDDNARRGTPTNGSEEP